MSTDLTSLDFATLPVDAGQMVERAYSVDWERCTLYRRTTDRSDGSVSYESCQVSDDEGSDFEPQNGILPRRLGDWQEVG